MSNVIELARYRGSAQREQHQPKPPDGTITIQWQPDGTHAYSISGAYAISRQLAVQALVEVSAELLADIGRAKF
ncbi:hypothetical protein [Cupriavidus gilardii]|uniref:hypothetical protein n=1 Tax=Cupriavidus gilardii TaxID=82541 RepID=UPI0015721954|nr:hypothetical protein [Cupriavidus gilardii]NSX05056.1 hypothetical protein [Cupriavidus gilardii]